MNNGTLEFAFTSLDLGTKQIAIELIDEEDLTNDYTLSILVVDHFKYQQENI